MNTNGVFGISSGDWGEGDVYFELKKYRKK
jgi:hypothetical protein